MSDMAIYQQSLVADPIAACATQASSQMHRKGLFTASCRCAPRQLQRPFATIVLWRFNGQKNTSCRSTVNIKMSIISS
jgi:hypothetical protein